MSTLPEKIHAAIRGLRTLQQEIQSVEERKTPLAEVDPATLNDFKKYIDQLRQFLWNCIQADRVKHGENLDDEIRSLRLQHVTELLHEIQQDSKVREFKPNPATVSFLNAVHQIADAAFERHTSADSEAEKAG